MYNENALPNGVKARADGGGDAWAEGHRHALGQTFNMQDLDAVMGHMAFGVNSSEKLFMEYVPDSYSNRYKTIREFLLVAMFDRKSTERAAFSAGNSVALAFYLWLCRMAETKALHAPKFFFVIGGQSPPWTMIEIDIFTGNRSGAVSVIESARDAAEWHNTWLDLGLSQLRSSIRREIGA